MGTRCRALWCSNVVLELWESPQHETHYVRVIFNKQEVDLPDMQPGEGAASCCVSWLAVLHLSPILVCVQAMFAP